MKYSPYHKIIPERVEVLKEITKLADKRGKIHLTTSYAKQKLSMMSIIINPSLKETILVTAGCHGNEPAPVYAIRDYLKQKKFPKNKRIVIVPCIVPDGFCLQIDRNKNNININRDFFSSKPQKETLILKQLVKHYKPNLVLNLHEDPDEYKFFLYLKGKEQHRKAEQIISLISSDIPYYKRKKIHGDIVINGIIKSSKLGKGFESYLAKKKIPNFCIETPGIFPLSQRIKAHKKILKYILK